MAKQVIDRGSAAGDGTGENLYLAFGKCIGNFDELYQLDADLGDVTAAKGASLVAIEAGTFTATEVQAALLELEARNNGTRTTDTVVIASSQIALDSLNVSISVSDNYTSTAATLFDVTSLPGGVKDGDRLYLYLDGTSTLTLSSVNTDVYIWADVTGVANTFVMEAWKVYQFHWDATYSTWSLDWKHIMDVKQQALEASGGGHTIFDESTELAQEANLKFTGNGVVASEGTGETVVTINGSAVPDTGAMSASLIIEYEFTSVTMILPTNSGAVRIHSFADCFIEFGDSSVVASGLTSIYFAAGTEALGLPVGATHIAVKTAGGIGRINVVGLDADSVGHLTTNTMIAVTAGSSSVALPTGTKMRLFSMTDCFINFGDSSVSADETSLFFEAGTEIISSTGTYIAAQRYTSDGGLYISGVA